jgi:hypothetical protein
VATASVWGRRQAHKAGYAGWQFTHRLGHAHVGYLSCEIGWVPRQPGQGCHELTGASERSMASERLCLPTSAERRTSLIVCGDLAVLGSRSGSGISALKTNAIVIHRQQKVRLDGGRLRGP